VGQWHDVVIVMDENARRIFDEAYATLDRVANVAVEERDFDDDPLISWHRNMPQPEPERRERRASHEKLTDAEAQRWQNYIDGKIAAANAERDKIWRDVLGAVVSEVRRQLRSEISAEVGSLRADVTIAKAHAGDRADVVRLPKFLERRRNA
jgi:hypothetical protein